MEVFITVSRAKHNNTFNITVTNACLTLLLMVDLANVNIERVAATIIGHFLKMTFSVNLFITSING